MSGTIRLLFTAVGLIIGSGWLFGAPSTYYDTLHRQPSRQALRDEQLKRQIAWVHQEDYGVYGGRKV